MQKILSAYGVTSRRAAEELIERGQVTVDGRVARLGDQADPKVNTIEVEGRRLEREPERITALLYKPRGFVSTRSDERGRRTVLTLVDLPGTRLVPVGRLDMNTEGLLLLSNDGALVHKLTHPSHAIEKEYWVWVRGDVEAAAPILREPMDIEGHQVQAIKVHTLGPAENGTKISLTISEGRHHQVRLMCDQAGLEILRLRRVRVGFLTLAGLRPGEHRLLTSKEISALHRLAQTGALPLLDNKGEDPNESSKSRTYNKNKTDSYGRQARTSSKRPGAEFTDKKAPLAKRSGTGFAEGHAVKRSGAGPRRKTSSGASPHKRAGSSRPNRHEGR